MSAPGMPLLTVRDLRSYLATSQGVVRAVDGVSFTLGEAEILGIVGESGSGKSVTCRTIVGLMPPGLTHISGEVIYHPHGDRSILSARQAELQSLRGSQLAMIFQDPMTALNPVVNVGDQVIEAVQAHAKLPAGEARSRAVSLLQRALIAIALASSPRLLLADEPTTSLDVIIQDQILSLLLDLQEDTGMSMILVSHDLAVISEVCDRIIVMYAGQVVEEGPAAGIITAPRHPYTRALLDAVPQGERRGQLRSITGSPPSLVDVPGGCRFAPRCRLATQECLSWETELIEISGPGRLARCLHHDEVERSPEWQASDSA